MILEEALLEIESLKEKNKFLANQAIETATESLLLGFGKEQAKVWKESIERPLLDKIEQLEAKLKGN